ncbi:MAG: hypothetical protein WCY88_03630 [Spongiibacteraceae bacterium]
MALFDPRFRDIAERENKALNKLTFIKNQLIKKRDDGIALAYEELIELERIEEVLKAASSAKPVPEVVDPLLVGTMQLLRADGCDRAQELLAHDNGKLIFGNPETGQIVAEPDRDQVVLSALTIGLLAAENANAPPVMVAPARKKGPNLIVPIKTDSAWSSLNRDFYRALGEARSLLDLARLVFPILSIEGDPDGRGEIKPVIESEEFASVVRELHARGITAEENQLRRKVNEALNKYQNVNGGATVDGLSLEPPDLGEISGVTVEKDNIRLMGPMIVAAMMDEVKAFQTLDHVVQRFQEATLVRFSREAGRKLYNWWREAPNRMSEMERRTFYAITLGLPGGEPTEFMNRSFNDLFLRFVSSVSDLVRQKELDNVLRASIPLATHQQQCRKSARDLIENLSMHGYGMAFYAAQELSKQVNEIIDILSDPDIRANYGARDMWQVIDQVATLELGGAKSTSRYRTLATCGTIITAWLANNVNRIVDTTGQIIDMNEVRHPQPKPPGRKATTHPNDYDLVNACELWLADSAITDSRVEELSQPRESPQTTSRPIQVPSMVQDMLNDVGVGFGR